uniref:Transposase n=1 Tax=Ascaris lumbricoides TaxID=6252 RepID=A0A0M3IJ62_ASCLU
MVASANQNLAADEGGNNLAIKLTSRIVTSKSTDKGWKWNRRRNQVKVELVEAGRLHKHCAYGTNAFTRFKNTLNFVTMSI